MLEIQWDLLARCVGGAIVAGLATMHAVAGYYHVRYYVRRRSEPETWKCQPSRFLTPRLHRMAIWSSSLNMALGGFVTGLLLYAFALGQIAPPIYMNVADYGWTYTLLSAVGLFILNDALAYYVHRMFHIKPLFRAIHRFHHRFIATSPYVTIAMHPVELLTLQAASFLPLFFIPVHAYVIGGVLAYSLIFNIIDHSGVRLHSSLPWQGPSMYHDDHHAYFHCNFGQHLMIWDRLHGTLRREGRTYGKEVFGGRGETNTKPSHPESDADLDPFVSY